MVAAVAAIWQGMAGPGSLSSIGHLTGSTRIDMRRILWLFIPLLLTSCFEEDEAVLPHELVTLRQQ
jgi:hypothetical protein